MKHVKTIIVVLVVATLAYFAWDLSSKSGNSKLADHALSDFAIKDTASIDKLIITDTRGSAGVTLTKSDDHWVMEEYDCIQEHLVLTILETIKHVRVKSPVGQAAVETVNKQLTTHHKKVEIYQNGEVSKTWYVGHPTPDHYGTYMLLKDPELGKSPEPFIMHLPTMHGSLNTRFITDPKEFECTGIFNYEPLEIASVSVRQPDSAQHNFKIVATGKNSFGLFSNDRIIEKFDTSAVRGYLLYFRKIHFERHNYEYGKKEIDSLIRTTPYFTIEVKTKMGASKKIRIHQRKYNFVKLDLQGNPLEYDQDRVWVFLPDNTLVIGQYHTFGKLLRNIDWFLPNTALIE
ncbi:hypothetical protein JYT72_01905 [Crocinitomix catalasitica]|nr:hypothetical protein [Crocinitomix catalasitica]